MSWLKKGFKHLVWDTDMPLWYNAANLGLLAATPFTGGASLAARAAMGTVGKVAIKSGIKAAASYSATAAKAGVNTVKGLAAKRAASPKGYAKSIVTKDFKSSKNGIPWRKGSLDSNQLSDLKLDLKEKFPELEHRVASRLINNAHVAAQRGSLTGRLALGSLKGAAKHPFLTAGAAVGADGYANGFGVSKWGIKTVTGIVLSGNPPPTDVSYQADADPNAGTPDDKGWLGKIFGTVGNPVDGVSTALTENFGLDPAMAKFAAVALIAVAGALAGNAIGGSAGWAIKLGVLGTALGSAYASGNDTGIGRNINDALTGLQNAIMPSGPETVPPTP